MNENTFITLLQQQEGRLLRIAWAILGQEADAWDALQEAVGQAWRHRRELKGGPEAFPAWIRRILVNCSLNLIRSRKHVIPIDPADISGPELFSPVDIDVETRAVWDVVKSLDAGHRQVITLRYLGDLSLQEIAVELEVPVGTVKSRLNRALARLREKLMQNGQRGVMP